MAFPAFLDTCVLVPGYLNDTLLRLASAETYRPLWSADVLEELHRNLVRMTSEAQADHRLRNMRRHFTDAEVTGYESLIPAMTNDEGDRHVLAAAVRGNAAVIVTANLRHFPEHALKPYEIEAVHPDEFLLDQLDLYPADEGSGAPAGSHERKDDGPAGTGARVTIRPGSGSPPPRRGH